MNKERVEGIVGSNLFKAGTIFVAVLCVFFAIKTVNEIKSGAIIGKDTPAINVISVSGQGEVLSAPDIATFSYSVTENGKLVAEAQKKATEKTNSVLKFLKESGVADKDVKTLSYDIHPTYEYTQGICTQYSCPPSKQILTGYEVSQTVQVKVRDISKAGTILSGIGEFEVQNLSGLSFEVDKKDELMKQARKQAIDKAEADAKTLASDLGVRLLRIVNFSEQNNNPVYPVYYDKMAYGMGGGATSAPAPQIPTGDSKITSTVSITYEIR